MHLCGTVHFISDSCIYASTANFNSARHWLLCHSQTVTVHCWCTVQLLHCLLLPLSNYHSNDCALCTMQSFWWLCWISALLCSATLLIHYNFHLALLLLARSNTGSPQICNTSKLLLYHYYSTPVATLWRALRLVSLQLCARLLLPNLLSPISHFQTWSSCPGNQNGFSCTHMPFLDVLARQHNQEGFFSFSQSSYSCT